MPGEEVHTGEQPKEEFAVVEDVKTPVADFHKRVPDMAHKVYCSYLTPVML